VAAKACINGLGQSDRIINTSRYKECQKLFSEAGKLAFAENKRRSIPNVYVEKDNIIKEYADGRKEILGKVKPDVAYNGPRKINLKKYANGRKEILGKVKPDVACNDSKKQKLSYA